MCHSKKYRLRHPDRVIAQRLKYKSKPDFKIKEKAYYEKNKERIKRISTDSHRKIRYGISTAQYNEMVKKQRGKCSICRLEKPLCIDHNHETGKVRELLCKDCNIGIGFLKDNIKLLQNAIKYLIRHTP